jgi:hypothetical protein
MIRDINAGRYAKNTSLVLVTHGLAARIFLMRWFHWTVEQVSWPLRFMLVPASQYAPAQPFSLSIAAASPVLLSAAQFMNVYNPPNAEVGAFDSTFFTSG